MTIAIALWGLGGGRALAGPARRAAPPDAEFQDVHLSRFRGGERVASGTARDLAYLRGRSEVSAAGAAATVAGRSGPPVQIRADHLTVMTRENRGIWTGHVHAVRAASAGRARVELSCDQLVTCLRGDDRLQGAICTGNVEVSEGDRKVWGDRAVYDGARGEVVVTGHPRGQQGQSRFHGEKLTFSVDTERIDVDQPVLDTPAPQAIEASASGGAR